MDNHGQVIFYSLMVAIVIIVMALALAPAVKQTVDTARSNTTENSVGMDCSNGTISDFQKAGCLAADISIFYFVGGLLTLAGIIAGAKILFG